MLVHTQILTHTSEHKWTHVATCGWRCWYWYFDFNIVQTSADGGNAIFNNKDVGPEDIICAVLPFHCVNVTHRCTAAMATNRLSAAAAPRGSDTATLFAHLHMYKYEGKNGTSTSVNYSTNCGRIDRKLISFKRSPGDDKDTRIIKACRRRSDRFVFLAAGCWLINKQYYFTRCEWLKFNHSVAT